MRFLDTGYIIAVGFEEDQYHAEAMAHWNELRQRPFRVLTTSFVLAEVVAFCMGCRRHDRAVALGRMLQDREWVEVVYVDRELVQAGWRLLLARPDKTYSLPDCVSFILMEREVVREALAFDEHFNQASFVRLPA